LNGNFDEPEVNGI
jgi:hypothetical protein